ncbi:MAG: aminotransferase class I/II-fold pyridoxal phosphate-dependent enzyme [Gammaproteobacteria bacterium]
MEEIVSYSSIDADDARPPIPVLPVLSWRTFFGSRRAPRFRCVLEAGEAVSVTSGTAAIALALEHAGMRDGDKVLLPAFHCTSMIEPFVAAGVRPVYYRIHADTSVDLADIAAKLDGSVKAVLATHYFGFYQDMRALRALCDKYRVVLIEDCAHAFFGEVQGHPIGSYGDYAIVSARKFFAIQDGGYLVSARHSLNGLAMKSAHWAFELKSALDVVELAVASARLKPLPIVLRPLVACKSRVWRKIKQQRHVSTIGPSVTDGYQYLDLGWVHARMSLVSRALMRLSTKEAIAQKRRENYGRMAGGLSQLSTAKPLFRHLPEDVVPYMFPLVLEHPDRIFPILKSKGVPIWRWEELADSDCEISRRYSKSLLQLPCHQELRDNEMDWMIAAIKQTVR